MRRSGGHQFRSAARRDRDVVLALEGWPHGIGIAGRDDRGIDRSGARRGSDPPGAGKLGEQTRAGLGEVHIGAGFIRAAPRWGPAIGRTAP
jgi:hypothetical protein